MKTLLRPTDWHGHKVRGSRFLTLASPVNNRQEVDDLLLRAKQEQPAATHYCYAYRLAVGSEIDEFATDAGEPSGSAGVPLLGALRRLELVNGAVVVVRFYGGTKLGIPGLIEAYGHGASEALAGASMADWVPMGQWRLQVPYPVVDKVKGTIRKMGGKLVSEAYDDAATLVVQLPVAQEEAFIAMATEWAGAGVGVESVEILE